MTSSSYSRFSPITIEFLSELHENNTKSWFETHRHVYTEYVLEPAQSLVSALSDAMLAIDPLLETSGDE